MASRLFSNPATNPATNLARPCPLLAVLAVLSCSPPPQLASCTAAVSPVITATRSSRRCISCGSSFQCAHFEAKRDSFTVILIRPNLNAASPFSPNPLLSPFGGHARLHHLSWRNDLLLAKLSLTFRFCWMATYSTAIERLTYLKLGGPELAGHRALLPDSLDVGALFPDHTCCRHNGQEDVAWNLSPKIQSRSTSLHYVALASRNWKRFSSRNFPLSSKPVEAPPGFAPRPSPPPLPPPPPPGRIAAAGLYLR